MSRTKSAFWGIISSQLYTIIAILVSLFSVPVIMRHLNAEIYGLSIVIFQITSYLGLFDFGLSAGVDKYLAGTRDDSDENRETITKIISTTLIVYSIIALIIAVSGNIFAIFAYKVFNAPAAYRHDIHNIVSLMSILLGFQMILRAIGGIFFAHQRQLLSNTLSFILSISNSVLTVLFVYLGFGLWSFVYSQLAVFAFNAGLNIYYFRKHYSYFAFKIKYFDFELLKKMLSYGLSLFVITISVQVVFQTDRIIIGSFISLAAVTLYSIMTRIPELVTQFLWKITDNSFPAIIEIAEKNKDGFEALHNKLMKITISLCTLCFWFLLLASQPFVKLWVGGQFYAGNYFLIITLYLYLIQHSFIHVTAMCLNAAGIARRIAFMYFLEAALNIVLSVVLVKKYQISGVIIGTIIAGALTSFWYIPYLAIKYMKSNILTYVKNILIPLLSVSLVGFLLYIGSRALFLGANNWITLIALSTGFFVIASLPMYYFNRDFVASIIDKIRDKGKQPQNLETDVLTKV